MVGAVVVMVGETVARALLTVINTGFVIGEVDADSTGFALAGRADW
jgi:hypothetical protein